MNLLLALDIKNVEFPYCLIITAVNFQNDSNDYSVMWFFLLHAVFASANTSDEFTSCRSGAARLTGLGSSRVGRLEVCVNNTWGTVCNSLETAWMMRNSAVACKMLGYGLAVRNTINPKRYGNSREGRTVFILHNKIIIIFV